MLVTLLGKVSWTSRCWPRLGRKLRFIRLRVKKGYPRSHTGKAGCAQPAMSTKYHDSQESPIMWVNHQQIEVNRIRHGFFEEIQLSVFYSSTLSENGLVILRKVNRNGNGSLALALGTSKTFLFFGEHGTLVAQAWDWDSNRDGVKS